MIIYALGFTGSSDDGMPTLAQIAAVTTYMATAVQPKHVHHGDCINSDEWFHNMCRDLSEYEPIIHIHPPTDPKKRAFCKGDIIYTEQPYLKRNRNIVAMSDMLVATPHGPEELRSGTWATIRYARQRGIPIYIVYPNGKVVQEG